MTDEVVTRLYRALVEALRRRDHPAGEPVKVADLYDDLIPYRAVRSRLGVELNADYEHALLRLLAGEHHGVRLEPADARDELRRELDSPYPDVGAYRRFSGSRVWVELPDRPHSPEEPEEPEEPGLSEASEPSEASSDKERPGGPAGPGPGRSERRRPGPGPGPAHHSSAAPERAPLRLHTDEPPEEAEDRRRSLAGRACSFCSEPLPERRRVRFCPYCGADQRLNPCPRCDAVLEEGWKYCVNCGTEVRR
ncbi:MAG: zinc ribbon domain-containing protein [Candidatus Longimicrobiales bacterium M2_2A_002]